MAIEVPPAVQNLFLVLTGEKWPRVNEDDLREKANVWGQTGDAMNADLLPLMVQAVETIRANFTGKAAIKFADMMAPYAVEEPRYIPQVAAQAQTLKEFLLEASTQVEYVKIISIGEVILLIAQIAWAIAMAFWTGGESMVWLSERIAIVRFLLERWWGRLVLQFAMAEIFGIAFQLALDVLTQAIQFAKHTRSKWDVNATIGAVEVGAIGGALSVPFSAIGHLFAAKITKVVVTRMDVDAGRMIAEVEKVMSNNAKGWERLSIPTLGREITMDLLRSAEMPLRVKIAAVGIHAFTEMVEEGLHEAITEGTVKAANGQGFSFNPFAFTSGVASHISEEIGHGLAHVIVPEKHAVTSDPRFDEKTPLLDKSADSENTESDVSDTETDDGSGTDALGPPVVAGTHPSVSATPPGNDSRAFSPPPSRTGSPAPAENGTPATAGSNGSTAQAPGRTANEPATSNGRSTTAPANGSLARGSANNGSAGDGTSSEGTGRGTGSTLPPTTSGFRGTPGQNGTGSPASTPGTTSRGITEPTTSPTTAAERPSESTATRTSAQTPTPGTGRGAQPGAEGTTTRPTTTSESTVPAKQTAQAGAERTPEASPSTDRNPFRTGTRPSASTPETGRTDPASSNNPFRTAQRPPADTPEAAPDRNPFRTGSRTSTPEAVPDRNPFRTGAQTSTPEAAPSTDRNPFRTGTAR